MRPRPVPARCSGSALDDDNGISEPSCSLPWGGASVGGASSMCSEPNRLVWPSLAVALAGRSTSPLSSIVTNACQPWRSIFVTCADIHIADPDAGIRLDVVDVGHLRLDDERARARCPGRPAAEASSALASRRSRTAPRPTRQRDGHSANDLAARASWSHPRWHHQAGAGRRPGSA